MSWVICMDDHEDSVGANRILWKVEWVPHHKNSVGAIQDLSGTAPAGFFFYRSNVRPNLLGVISQISLRRPRIRSARWRNIIRYCAEHGSGTMLKLDLDSHER